MYLRFYTLVRNTSEKLQTFRRTCGIKKFNFLLVKFESIIKERLLFRVPRNIIYMILHRVKYLFK